MAVAKQTLKIKCISNYRLNDNTGILQIFYNNTLTAKYARLRVYKGINQESHKPMFEYIKVSIADELQSLLESEVSKHEQTNLVQAKPKVNIEQNSKISSLNQKTNKK